MDEGQEPDQYEERLKEVFNSFDTSGCGSLSPEELSDLCQSLHLEDATPVLLHTLLQNQDHLTARVDFDQFKNALILVLSSTLESHQAEQEASLSPEFPEIQPKFVKGGKRYGRRSTPEFSEPEESGVLNLNLADEEDLEDTYDSAVPRKRERWNAHKTSTEEYEAEGQMHLWNPDEPSTPQGSTASLSARLEGQLREACDELEIAWDGSADHAELLTLCEHLGLELNGEVLLNLTGDGVMNVQEFVSRVLNHNKPPTPSASTPYRQLKRHHSTQPFDEGGRRISALPSSIGMRLFSTLDDGTGFTPVEYILDAWIDEGIENSAEILQALNFDLDGKLSLGDLTAALENELLVTKNGIHQAALASFKSEIRCLVERVDREIREKEKIQLDLERAEKQKTQLAAEVDEHHSAIEHKNNLNLRKLEQDYKEKLTAVRSELMKEMDHIQQQAGLQREELEAEMEKIREEESFLRDHLSISVKENRRLEMELLDSTEKVVEAQSQVAKLQTNLENIMKDKFGDLDPGSADFLLQEERIKQLRSTYEAQCRELQDRIDELQSELQECRTLGRAHESCSKPLSEELESKSPGTESDPGLGSDEVQPFSVSLEAEMMLEQLKEQHFQEIEELRNQLETKISEFDKIVENQKVAHEDQKATLIIQHQQEVQTLKEEVASVQSQLEQVKLEQTCLEQNQAGKSKELENQQQEVENLRQQLLEAHRHITVLEDQLITVEGQQAQTEEDHLTMMEQLRTQHAVEITRLKEEQAELEARLGEEREELQDQKAELERRLLDDWEREKKVLEEFHESDLTAQVEEAKRMFQEEREEVVKKLTNQWQEERTRLDEQNNESLQVLLEEEMLKLVKEQEEKENQLKEQWESEQAQLQQHHEKVTLDRIIQERLQLQEQFEQRERRLREEWERERLQLEEDYEGMIQDRLNEEKEKLETEDEERIEMLIAEERAHLERSHQEAVRKLMDGHAEERNALGAMLDKLRDDITQERKEVETSFTQRISQVEDGFSDNQESVAKRFQTDILNLEERFQSELHAFSENHAMQKLHWEAEIRKALESAEEQRRTMENMEAERRELENVHSEEMEALKIENKQLQSDLEEMMSRAQGKEMELSMQLKDLHSQLQEKHELLAQSESRAGHVQLLVEEFKQEREQLLSTYSLLETKYCEVLSMSEGQVVERVQLLTEREDLKVKVEELEMLLKQAAMDFDLDRQELQENLSILEKRLREETDVSEIELKLLSASPEKGQDEEMKHLYLIDHAVSQYQTEVTLPGGNVDGFCEGYRGDNVVPDPMLEDQSPERGELFCRDCDHYIPDAPGTYLSAEKINRDASQEMLREIVSSLQAFVDGETQGAVEFHSVETKPQEDSGGCSHEDEPHHETVVGASGLEETGDPDECSVEDDEIKSSPNNSHNRQELVVDSDSDHENHSGGPHDCVETLDHENQEVLKLQALCNTSIDENLLLHEKVSLLQQKAEILENLLAHNSEKVRSGRQAVEENYKLKVQMLLLMEHIKELEIKTIQTSDLQIRYEDCMCENAKLKEQNRDLEQKVWSLEGRADVLHGFQSRRVSLMDDISRMREENAQLFGLLGQVGGQEGCSESEQPESPTEEAFLHLDGHLQAETFTQDCCEEFEEQNAELRRALAELQDESQALTETTHACRSTASRLAEENLLLSQNIAALKDGDLKRTRDELTQSKEDLKNEKFAAQQAADRFKQQLSELNLQSQQLEGENETLMEKNAQNTADIEGLRQQLAKLIKEMERMEITHAEEKKEMAVCVSGLEAELNKALEDTAQLEERNVQLSQQLSVPREKVDSAESPLRHFLEERHVEDAAGLQQPAKARDKVKTADERVQALNRQTAHLKSDLRVLQQERNSLKLEVSGLHKQLQNANDKNHVLERAFHSSGLQNHTKKLYRDGMSRILEQEQQLLRQEKERLQAEVHKIKSDLIQSKEKVRQLEVTALSLNKHRQQSQSSKVKALEEENAALKQELEAHRKLTKSCEAGQHAELEALRQQNEALNAQITGLSSQLLESFQAQFGGFLPPSPRRMQRGQHHGENPDNMQEERERKMKSMEERMKEIELSLFNVKLLLKEKVALLNDQLHKNGKADVLIKDLYVEISHLVKALEITEQRHKIAEKKNYLLEEKISTLNKIVRDLNPSNLPALSYNYKYT